MILITNTISMMKIRCFYLLLLISIIMLSKSKNISFKIQILRLVVEDIHRDILSIIHTFKTFFRNLDINELIFVCLRNQHVKYKVVLENGKQRFANCVSNAAGN